MAIAPVVEADGHASAYAALTAMVLSGKCQRTLELLGMPTEVVSAAETPPLQ